MNFPIKFSWRNISPFLHKPIIPSTRVVSPKWSDLHENNIIAHYWLFPTLLSTWFQWQTVRTCKLDDPGGGGVLRNCLAPPTAKIKRWSTYTPTSPNRGHFRGQRKFLCVRWVHNFCAIVFQRVPLIRNECVRRPS